MLTEKQLFGEYWSLRHQIVSMGITGKWRGESGYHQAYARRPVATCRDDPRQ